MVSIASIEGGKVENLKIQDLCPKIQKSEIGYDVKTEVSENDTNTNLFEKLPMDSFVMKHQILPYFLDNVFRIELILKKLDFDSPDKRKYSSEEYDEISDVLLKYEKEYRISLNEQIKEYLEKQKILTISQKQISKLPLSVFDYHNNIEIMFNTPPSSAVKLKRKNNGWFAKKYAFYNEQLENIDDLIPDIEKITKLLGINSFMWKKSPENSFLKRMFTQFF